MNRFNTTRKQQARANANKFLYEFHEYTKYFWDSEYWENKEDGIVSGIRLAIGQYYQKGAAEKGIPFDEFVCALSPNFCGGSLKSARKSGALPDYEYRKAKKHCIGEGYANPDTGHLGFYRKGTK